MPWTAEQFRLRHNHKLSDRQAGKASRVANALLAKYGDEGKAIRIANSVVHKAAGGSTDFKGIVDGYAGGGKVSQLIDFAIKNLHIRPDETHEPTSAMLELAKSNPYQFGTFGENSPDYQKLLRQYQFNPKLHDKDLDLLDTYAQGAPYHKTIADTDRLRWLINKYGIVLPPDVQLHRGDYTIEDRIKSGDTFPSDRTRSTTTDQKLAHDFADYKRDSGQPIVHNLQPGRNKVLPLPISGQNEFLIPPGPKGTIRIDSANLGSEFGDDSTWYTSGSIGPGYAPGGMVKAIMALLRPAEEAAPSKLDQLRMAYAKAHQNWLTSAPGGLGGIDTQPLSDYLRLAQEHVSGGDSINALANARAALDRSGVAARSASNPLMIGRARTKFGQQALGQLYDAHDYMNDVQGQLDPESHVAFPYPSRF